MDQVKDIYRENEYWKCRLTGFFYLSVVMYKRSDLIKKKKKTILREKLEEVFPT